MLQELTGHGALQEVSDEQLTRLLLDLFKARSISF
jgi:hypothetical protein